MKNDAPIGNTFMSQQYDASGKEHGIVRKIYNDSEIVYCTMRNGVDFGLSRVITDESVCFTVDGVDGELAFLVLDEQLAVKEHSGSHKHLLDWVVKSTSNA